jgi:predicted nucleic acid-binding protein
VITRYSHGLLLDRMWDLRDNVSAYDAAFVALAEALALPLVTTDARLASAPGHRAMIEAY